MRANCLALIDTNVIIDVLQRRDPFFEDAAQIMRFSEAGLMNASFSSLSVANIAYILRKSLNPERTDDIVSTLAMVLRIEKLEQSDLLTAAHLKWNDFEDAIQHATARRIGADFIITRNTRDFESSDIQVVAPHEFLRLASFD